MCFAYHLLKAYYVPKVRDDLLLSVTRKEVLLTCLYFYYVNIEISLVSSQMVIKSTLAALFKLCRASEENNGEFIFFILS